MATNITPTQAIMASSAVLSTNSSVNPDVSVSTQPAASLARMSNMEKEIQSTTCNSTPKPTRVGITPLLGSVGLQIYRLLEME